MKIKGVNDVESGFIKGILAPYFKKYKFYFYGSRVRGDFRPLSDLDIMIKGESPMPADDFEALKEAFDDSNLPYIVNLADFYNISDEFYQMIKDDFVLAE